MLLKPLEFDECLPPAGLVPHIQYFICFLSALLSRPEWDYCSYLTYKNNLGSEEESNLLKMPQLMDGRIGNQTRKLKFSLKFFL